MPIRFRQLRYFLKVVDLGGFTRAAESLNVAQPALSQQIAKLEAELDTQLLVRTPKGAVPTESGRILYRCGQQILQQLEIAQAEIRSSSESPAGHVSIGLPGSASLILSVPLLREMREQYPHISLEMREADNDQLAELLLTGRIDIALLHNFSSFKGMREEQLLRERLFLVIADKPSFPVPATEPVSLEALSRLPLVLPGANAPKHQMLEAMFRASELQLNIVAETSAISTTVAVVQAGLGAAILPWSAARAGLESGELRALTIEQPRFSRPISMCSAQAHPSSTAALATGRALRKVVCDLAGSGAWREVELLVDPAFV